MKNTCKVNTVIREDSIQKQKCTLYRAIQTHKMETLFFSFLNYYYT